MKWCLDKVCNCIHYSLSSTFFHVLGLISRSIQGSRRLLRSGWDCTIRGGYSAVAFPIQPSVLFSECLRGVLNALDYIK
jgi:hypothetical protein